MGHKVGEIRLGKTFSEEVTHMTKAEENEVTDVGGEEDIIWRLLDGVFFHRFGVVMLGDAAIGLVCTVTKLRVNGGKDLFRGWGCKGVRETIALIVFVENGVF
jgi:hypothetical protein